MLCLWIVNVQVVNQRIGSCAFKVILATFSFIIADEIGYVQICLNLVVSTSHHKTGLSTQAERADLRLVQSSSLIHSRAS